MVKVEERTGMKPESETEEKSLYEKPCHCLLCGQLGPALLYGHWICDHCKNVVQAESGEEAQDRKGGRWSGVGGTAPL